MIIDIYWEKPELVSVKKAAIELKVPHIITPASVCPYAHALNPTQRKPCPSLDL